MATFSITDLEVLSGPHVARAWFGEFDLPSGYARLHSGVGRVTAGGYEWRGVSDPIGGQMVGVSAIEDPRFGTAAKVDIILGSVNLAFLQSVKADARDIEGRSAKIWFGMFDPETNEVIMFKPLFPGQMSRPRIRWQGVGVRYVQISVESMWSAKNYPFGGKWSSADHRRKWPGDKAMDLGGVKTTEQWK